MIGSRGPEEEVAEEDLRRLDAHEKAMGRPVRLERYDPALDPYRGVCGGCGRRVDAGDEGGACVWRGGPWHPACREADRS